LWKIDFKKKERKARKEPSPTRLTPLNLRETEIPAHFPAPLSARHDFMRMYRESLS
jgi:hypothetical protein